MITTPNRFAAVYSEVARSWVVRDKVDGQEMSCKDRCVAESRASLCNAAWKLKVKKSLPRARRFAPLSEIA